MRADRTEALAWAFTRRAGQLAAGVALWAVAWPVFAPIVAVAVVSDAIARERDSLTEALNGWSLTEALQGWHERHVAQRAEIERLTKERDEAERRTAERIAAWMESLDDGSMHLDPVEAAADIRAGAWRNKENAK